MARIAYLAAAFLITILSGCTTTQQPEDPNKLSTIPWNRPEKWEGQGPMGGMMGTQ